MNIIYVLASREFDITNKVPIYTWIYNQSGTLTDTNPQFGNKTFVGNEAELLQYLATL